MVTQFAYFISKSLSLPSGPKHKPSALEKFERLEKLERIRGPRLQTEASVENVENG